MALISTPGVCIDFKSMIDIALGSGDPGLVNFKVLHTFLQSLVTHLNIEPVKVEYHGTQEKTLNKFLEKEPEARGDDYQILKYEQQGVIFVENFTTEVVADPQNEKTDAEKQHFTASCLAGNLDIFQKDDSNKCCEELGNELKKLQDALVASGVIDLDSQGNPTVPESHVSNQVSVSAISKTSSTATPQDLSKNNPSLSNFVSDTDEFKNQTEIETDFDDQICAEARKKHLLNKFRQFKEKIIARLCPFEKELCKIQTQIKDMNDQLQDVIDTTERQNTHLRDIRSQLSQILIKHDCLTQLTNCLVEDRDALKYQLSVNREEIEFMKITKSDRDELDAIKQLKADKCLVDTKVSCLLFESVRKDLSCSMVKVMDKIREKDEFIMSALKDLDRSISEKYTIEESKMLRNELIQEFHQINQRIDILIQNLTCKEINPPNDNLEKPICELQSSKKRIIREILTAHHIVDPVLPSLCCNRDFFISDSTPEPTIGLKAGKNGVLYRVDTSNKEK